MSDPASVRRVSEAALADAGARVNPDLPVIDFASLSLRDGADVARRALALNVLARVAFDWPRDVALRWLEQHGLTAALQPDELDLMRRPHPPGDGDRWLRLHVETLGMAAWLGGLEPELLLPWTALPDGTAAHFPDPFADESPAAFLARFQLLPRDRIEHLLDLYYRAHWHARQCNAEGAPNPQAPYATVQFRRLMLEWTCHDGIDWHDVALDT